MKVLSRLEVFLFGFVSALFVDSFAMCVFALLASVVFVFGPQIIASCYVVGLSTSFISQLFELSVAQKIEPRERKCG